MKSIGLTEEHKSKLLEMCNKLFPEYKEIILTKQKCLNFGFKNHRSYTSRIANMSIHWFEFCMTHLAERIDCDLAHNIIYMKNHPVDYLYEEFKNLS